MYSERFSFHIFKIIKKHFITYNVILHYTFYLFLLYSLLAVVIFILNTNKNKKGLFYNFILLYNLFTSNEYVRTLFFTYNFFDKNTRR